MKSTDYVDSAITFWKQVGRKLPKWVTVTMRCIECGATHRFEWQQQRPGGVEHAETMLHEPWCSVDMRNIRQTITAVRR
jgi:hypothetical protein